ncbi:MAG: efflux RND transporter periplasmic adaptor subunit [Acidimicrobiia bacterium]|nr:efflux RND transporter periplasmic adaptor subunit [Acidimicrobiia bacterium]
MRNVLTLTLALGTLGLLAAGCGSSEPSAAAATPPVEHRVDVPAITVGTADIETTLQITGNLMPQTRVGVLSKLPGTLSRVAVELGGRVRAGQVVAALDRREIDAQVDAAAAAVNVARAGVEAADAALANAALEHDRAKNLFERGALPKQRLDGAETARRASAAQRDLAQATLAQAEAALRRAREIQRDATLTSPIDGVIVERNYDAGSLVGPGDKPVVVVADLRVMKLEAGVSELEAGRLRVGMPVRVSVQARPGDVFDGRLAAMAPEVDARNRHFAIEVRVPNPAGVLLSGMYGSATIPLDRAAQVVAVPRNAVTTRGGKRVALKIDGDTVQEVPVTEGLANAAVVQIASGLRAGDTVVSDARRDVAAGVKVNPVFTK